MAPIIVTHKSGDYQGDVQYGAVPPFKKKECFTAACLALACCLSRTRGWKHGTQDGIDASKKDRVRSHDRQNAEPRLFAARRLAVSKNSEWRGVEILPH
jgi:hypothetical protein